MCQLAARFGRRIIHVFDRGFVGELWVRVCVVVANVRFILRWTGKMHLLDEKGQCRPAWKAVVGKKQGQEQRLFWHARGHQVMRLRVAWARVWHPSHPDHPLRIVADHLRSPDGTIEVRRQAISVADRWLQAGGNQEVGLRVLMRRVMQKRASPAHEVGCRSWRSARTPSLSLR